MAAADDDSPRSAAERHDADLVARCRAGDDAAWAELVERYARYVYAISIQGFRLSAHDAEDVFQDTFVRVYDRLDRLRDDEAFRPWLAQTTRRLCLDRLRENGRLEPFDETVRLEESADALERLDEALAVRDALAELSPNCQEILDRFFARDESYRMIGAALDLPPGTIASRISRCLRSLRERLEGRKTAVLES